MGMTRDLGIVMGLGNWQWFLRIWYKMKYKGVVTRQISSQLYLVTSSCNALVTQLVTERVPTSSVHHHYSLLSWKRSMKRFYDGNGRFCVDYKGLNKLRSVMNMFIVNSSLGSAQGQVSTHVATRNETWAPAEVVVFFHRLWPRAACNRAYWIQEHPSWNISHKVKWDETRKSFPLGVTSSVTTL